VRSDEPVHHYHKLLGDAVAIEKVMFYQDLGSPQTGR